MTALSSTTRIRAPVTSTGAALRPFGLPALGRASVNQKVEPLPSVLSTPISPPIRWTRREVMARPRPVPSWRRVEEASTWLNFSNTCFSLSFGMPMPVSVTEMRSFAMPPIDFAGHIDEDVARIGEFDSVAEQVGDDLADAADIADHQIVQMRRDPHDEFEILFLGAGGNQRRDVLDRLGEIERGRVEHELAGVDLGEVENVVDDGQQRIARFHDDVGECLLLRVEFGFGEEFGHAEHAVHRRADLVAHIGQEFRLGAIGEHGAALRFLKLALALLEFGDVGAGADEMDGAVDRDQPASSWRSVAAPSRRDG